MTHQIGSWGRQYRKLLLTLLTCFRGWTLMGCPEKCEKLAWGEGAIFLFDGWSLPLAIPPSAPLINRSSR